MSADAQLTVFYAAMSPILAALLWWLRRRSEPRIKWLSESIHWYNTTPTLVQAQFEPKRFNYNE